MAGTAIRIVGIDPGLRRTGWGVIESDGVRLSYVASGLVTSQSDEDLAWRLREIYEMVRDPRGRDSFLIKIESSSQIAELAFPNDGCTISKRLESDLKRLKLEVDVQDAAA